MRICAWSVPFLLLFCRTSLGTEPKPPVAELPGSRVRFIDQVILASERAGILASVPVREGDRVESGQILASLKDEVLKARLEYAAEQAASDVKVREARKMAELAAAELQIAEDAVRREPNAVAKTELLRLKLDSERSQLQIEAADLEFRLLHHRRAEAQAEVDASQVKAPFEGVVVHTFKSRGEAVQLGDPIVELVSNRRVKVEGYLPVSLISSVQTGQPVRVTQVRPGNARAVLEPAATATGTVVFIDVSVEPVTERVRIWAEVDNQNGTLTVGLPATLLILEGDRALN